MKAIDEKPLLVLSPDERTWDDDRRMLFLGLWCLKFSRGEYHKKLEYQVVPEHSVTHEEKQKCLVDVIELKNEILPELVRTLNQSHNVSFSLRYWDILLGHWLHRFISVVYKCYNDIEALKKMGVESLDVAYLTSDHYSLATANSYDFIFAANDTTWRSFLYREIASTELPNLNVINEIKVDELEFNFKPRSIKNPIRFRSICLNLLSAISRKLCSLNSIVISQSYLPLLKELQLQLSLGQVPSLYVSPAPPPQVSLNYIIRDKLSESLVKEVSGANYFVRSILGRAIPKCFIENYKYIREEVQTCFGPQNPRVIFTSNRFDTDEYFKAWLAEKVEEGAAYVVGQHGNNYGVHFHYGSYAFPERRQCDAFISWGWRNTTEKVIAGFNFKNAGLEKGKYQTNGHLLLIENVISHRVDPYDIDEAYRIYRKEQFQFVDKLSSPVVDHLLVRLHGAFRDHGWCDDERWRARYANIKLELGSSQIGEIVSKSRLVVHSYDSTGILETLNLNIPTLCFWNGGFDHVESSAREAYELLRRVGIFHSTPDSAARFINDNWDSIEEWWNRAEVQQVREKFCSLYSSDSPGPVLDLRKILLDISRGKA